MYVLSINNINWARNLADRLELLDYDERDKAIVHMNEVLDEDYISMGFEIEDKKTTIKR